MAMRNRTGSPSDTGGGRIEARIKSRRTPERPGSVPQSTRPSDSASRVLVCENRRRSEAPISAALRSEGIQTSTCPDGTALLEEVMRVLPDVVLFLLRPRNEQDLGVLELLRRAAPTVPLVLVASEGSLDTQKLVQSLRPIYYAVWPVEGAELRAAVEAALTRKGHHLP